MTARDVHLLACPAGHSISPAMHQAAFDRLGIDATYLALEVEPAALSAAIDGFRRSAAFLGANVTVPHKQAVMTLLDEVTVEALSIGAVNTIVKREGRLIGSNTDASGFTRALAELWPAVDAHGGRTDVHALLLGAGGSARAVAWALQHEEVTVGIHARREEAAARLVAELGSADTVSGGLVVVSPHETAAWLEMCDLLINSTPVGMAGGGAEDANPAPQPLSGMRPDAVVMDLVYRPAVTPLLAEARRLGLRHQNGMPMLVWQGAGSFESWTQRKAPVDVMWAAARAALERAL